MIKTKEQEKKLEQLLGRTMIEAGKGEPSGTYLIISHIKDNFDRAEIEFLESIEKDIMKIAYKNGVKTYLNIARGFLEKKSYHADHYFSEAREYASKVGIFKRLKLELTILSLYLRIK